MDKIEVPEIVINKTLAEFEGLCYLRDHEDDSAKAYYRIKGSEKIITRSKHTHDLNLTIPIAAKLINSGPSIWDDFTLNHSGSGGYYIGFLKNGTMLRKCDWLELYENPQLGAAHEVYHELVYFNGLRHG